MNFVNINTVLNVYWNGVTNNLWLIIQWYIVNIKVVNFTFTFDRIYLVDVTDNALVCVVKQ